MKNILKAIVEGVLLVILISGSIYNTYSNDVENENVGPGILMKESDFDGNNMIYYSYGIGPIVSEVETVDLHYQAPVTVESNILNPIDNSLIDMGPKSANNDNYVLHYINDGGPGMGVETNELGAPMYYSDGGPGMTVMALSDSEDEYVDNGPTAVESTADPRNFLQMLLDLIPSNGEGIYRSYKKNTKTTTK